MCPIPFQKIATKRKIVQEKEKKEEAKSLEDQVGDNGGLFHFQYGYDLLRCCCLRP